jgi:hypothetical protein
VVDDEIEIRSVCRALVEKVLLREWSKVLTIPKLEKAERYGDG